jgi:hypothetical protein
MSRKVRKQVYIESYQESALKRFSERTGLSEAEVIRQAIDQHIQQKHTSRSVMRDPRAWERARKFAEELMAKGPVPGGRTWRREDLYDR